MFGKKDISVGRREEKEKKCKKSLNKVWRKEKNNLPLHYH